MSKTSISELFSVEKVLKSKEVQSHCWLVCPALIIVKYQRNFLSFFPSFSCTWWFYWYYRNPDYITLAFSGTVKQESSLFCSKTHLNGKHIVFIICQCWMSRVAIATAIWGLADFRPVNGVDKQSTFKTRREQLLFIQARFKISKCL